MGKSYLQYHMLNKDTNISSVGSWVENISEITLWPDILLTVPPLLPHTPSSQLTDWGGRGVVQMLTHSVLRDVGEFQVIKTFCDSFLPLISGGFRRKHASQLGCGE